MGISFKHAPKDYKWSLTEYGMERRSVREKFDPFGKTKTSYEESVPASWVSRGYVIAVKKEV